MELLKTARRQADNAVEKFDSLRKVVRSQIIGAIVRRNPHAVSSAKAALLTSSPSKVNQGEIKKTRAISSNLPNSTGRQQAKVTTEAADDFKQHLVSALLTILSTYEFDAKHPLVKDLYDQLGVDALGKQPSEITVKIEQEVSTMLHMVPQGEDEKNSKVNYLSTSGHSTLRSNPNEQAFRWVGVKTELHNLRHIFEEILLEKVRMFDTQLAQLTKMGSETTDKKKFEAIKEAKMKELAERGFCDVEIRDQTSFTLQKWTKECEDEFREGKRTFMSKFHSNDQTPIIYQFVKKYTQTVRAREHIYEKWQHREKTGITPEELRYLCATSVFLNRTLNESERQRIKQNISMIGKRLYSELQFKIAEKIIETYRKFVKKVSDLRAAYYMDLTRQRKREINSSISHAKPERKKAYEKKVAMFRRIVEGERMKIKLNCRLYRWISRFIANLKARARTLRKHQDSPSKSSSRLLRSVSAQGTQNTAIKTAKTRQQESSGFASSRISARPSSSAPKLSLNSPSTLMLRMKSEHPSSRVLKRVQHSTVSQHARKYIEGDEFYYKPSLQRSIHDFNKMNARMDPQLVQRAKKSLLTQFSGGPASKEKRTLQSKTTNGRSERQDKQDLQNSVYSYQLNRQLPSYQGIKLNLLILVQSTWRAYMERKRFLTLIQSSREKSQIRFQEQLRIMNRLYPVGKKISYRQILKRIKAIRLLKDNSLVELVSRRIKMEWTPGDPSLSLAKSNLQYYSTSELSFPLQASSRSGITTNEVNPNVTDILQNYVANLSKPYERSQVKIVQKYTCFTDKKLSNEQLRVRYVRQGPQKIQEFLRLVQNNGFHKIKEKGFIVTAKDINQIGDKLTHNRLNKDGRPIVACSVWWAAYNGNTTLLRHLLQGGGNPNSADLQGNTCLHVSLQQKAPFEVIFLLLDYGADLNKTNNDGHTCLYFASNAMLKGLGLEQGIVSKNNQIALGDNNRAYWKAKLQEPFIDHLH